MNEIHGLARVRKLAAVSGDLQTVRVEDGVDCVRLSLSTSSYPAGLTPDEAEWIARQLIECAKRVRGEPDGGHA